MEYVVVTFPKTRTVIIDGDAGGITGEVLLVEKGTHRFQLDGSQNYQPKWKQTVVKNTTFASPMEVSFEIIENDPTTATLEAAAPAKTMGRDDTGEPIEAALAEPPPLPAPKTPEPPPGPKVGEKVGFIQLPTKPEPKPPDKFGSGKPSPSQKTFTPSKAGFGQPPQKPGAKPDLGANDPESPKREAPGTATDVSPFDPATAVSQFLPGIANDGVDGDPHIDIKADVQSIARVMCMQQVKPPLSIALFGNWGSGKSFFMRQLRKEVGKITESPDAGPNDKPFYKDIIQIEFNAWHYVEANLWASLVSHIFENLKSPGELDQLKQQKEQEALLEKLGSAQKQKEEAQQKLKDAKKKEEVAQKELAQKEAERQEKLHALEEVKAKDLLKAVLTEHETDIKRNVTDVQTKLGLQGAVNTIEDAGKALAEAKEIGGDIAKFIRTFISAPGRGKRLAFVLLSLGAVVVIPAVFTVIAGLNEWKPWTDALKWVATIVGAVGALIKPLRDTTRNFCSVLEKLRAASARFDAVVKEKTQAQDSAVQTARTDVATAARAVATAKDKVKEAEGAIAAAEEALAKASPRGLLNAFIEERAASDDYRKNLGILALVRRDFEKLSNLLKGVRGDSNAIEYRNLPRIDRIILYIDDLDRCPPKQVVEVLQAIHLLLAFELFVVVVGVDPRWISHSLEKYYPELLGNDLDTIPMRSQQNRKSGSTNAEKHSSSHDTAQPLDYLEKIFQIPFWIKPIGGQETGALIKGLLTPDLPRPAKSQERQEENKPALDSQVTAQVMDTAGKSSETEVGFADTTLSEAEVKFMSDLKWLAGTTPRAIKRYVNIYRLLRARVSRDRVDEFEGKAGKPREFEAVMYLLALFNTAPLLAQKFCKELEKFKESEGLEQSKKGEQRNSSKKQRPNARLTDVLTKMKQVGGFTSIEQALINALENYTKEFDSMKRAFTESQFQPSDPPTIDPFCRWHPVVSRFSFVGESGRNLESELRVTKA